MRERFFPLLRKLSMKSLAKEKVKLISDQERTRGHFKTIILAKVRMVPRTQCGQLCKETRILLHNFCRVVRAAVPESNLTVLSQIK